MYSFKIMQVFFFYYYFYIGVYDFIKRLASIVMTICCFWLKPGMQCT